MPLPTLESFTAALDRTCADVLGDAIQYAHTGTPFVTLRAHVDYRDASRPLDVGEVIEQDVTLSILKVDVPGRPTAQTRLTLPRIAGKTFRPINIRTDESGTAWEFEVKVVVDA